MRLRTFFRLLLLVGVVGRALVDYLFRVAPVPAARKRTARAQWMHRAAVLHLRLFNYSANISGSVPRTGLLVANHLSYLDILAIGSVTPAVFVSKADVQHWPVFGPLATLAGTVYIERERRLAVGAVNEQIRTALASGVLVVIFPEGTSSDGQAVLPFRSSLLEPVAGGAHDITVGRLRYSLPAGQGNPGQEVCYWGDHSFFPHLLNLLGKPSVQGEIRFRHFGAPSADRKELAKQLQSAVESL